MRRHILSVHPGISRPVQQIGLPLACLVLVAALAGGMAAAFAASSSPSPSAAQIILRAAWTNDPDNLNPFIGYESSAYEIMHLNHDLLVGWKPDTQPAPELATSWSCTDGGKVWTFKIRQGVK